MTDQIPPRAGGQANLTGIEYQLVRSLLSATRVWDAEPDDVGGLTGYRLVLEPSDGGDLRVEGATAVDIEQMKTRSRGTWGLAEVVQGVLPDLYGAVVKCRERGQDARETRFVTDRRRGQWGSVESFFRSLATRTEPAGDAVSCTLDDSERIPFTAPTVERRLNEAGLSPTERGLFQYIARVVTSSDTPTAREERDVWMLLSAFRFVEIAGDTVRAEVEARLRNRVLRVENTERVLQGLLGDFLQRAKSGATIVIRSLLAEHGLADIPLEDRCALVEQGRRSLERTLDRLGYLAKHDVRAARWQARRGPLIDDGEAAEPHDPRLSGNAVSRGEVAAARPWVLCGESGQGKSWALFARALSLAERGRLVVLIEAGPTLEATCQRAAATFCNAIWGHDGEIPLERIHQRLRTADPNHADDWLDLLVDGLNDLDLARRLAAYDWRERGIRLSFSLRSSGDVTPEILDSACQLTEVPDFSSRELHDYLQIRLGDGGLRVGCYEDTLLCRPLMARIFCDLAEESHGELPPENEFRLMVRRWSSFAAEAPATVGVFAGLAAEPPAGRAYPWSMRTLHEAGISDRGVLHLCDKGLLRRGADGQSVELSHDRFLSWATAQGWSVLLRDDRLMPDELAQRLHDVTDSSTTERRWGRRWLGDVFLDVLWLLLEPGLALRNAVARILWDTKDRLQNDALAMIGERIVPVLFDLIRKDPRERWYWLRPLKLIRSPEVPNGACDLLESEDRETRLAGAELLAEQPSEAALDSLWALRCSLDRDEPRNLVAIHGAVDGALVACSRTADDWVRRALRTAHPDREPVDTLVYLLPRMTNGRVLWEELKDTIFSKLSGEHERAVVACLETFEDRGHNDWLKERVHRPGLIAAAARGALFHLEPGRAPDPIEGDAAHAGLGRGWWLLPHLNADQETAQEFIAETVERSEDPFQAAWTLLSGFESRMAPEALDRVLDVTGERLAAALAKPKSGKHDPLWAPFHFLARVRSLRLIERVEARRGSNLEERLSEWLCMQGPNHGPTWRPREEDALVTLKRINGAGLTRVANSWLEQARTAWATREAIDLAVARPDESTADLLSEIAARDTHDGAGDGPEYPIDQVRATVGLASVGRTDLAVLGAMRWSTRLSWEDVDLLGAYRPTGADLEPVIQALAQADEPDPDVVFALGLGRRPEDVVHIHGILKRAPLRSELAASCLLALYVIGDRSAKTHHAYLEHLGFPGTEYACTLGLLQVRTSEALAVLTDRLGGLTKERLSSSDNAVMIAANLLRLEQTRLEVAQFLWEKLDRHTILFVVGHELPPFADLNRPDVDAWLHDLAFGHRRPHLDWGAQVGAIRAIAKRDPIRAFEAAQRLMAAEAPRRDQAPGLLLEIEAERSLPSMRDRLEHEDEILVLAAIGEALFAAGRSGSLVEWLRDPGPGVREGACIAAEVLPWADHLEEAVRPLLYDVDVYVRVAANRTLDCLCRARELDRLVDALAAETDTSRQWSLLDACLEEGYPGLWQPQGWINRLWDSLSPAMRRRARERLKERRKKVRGKLKQRKRRE